MLSNKCIDKQYPKIIPSNKPSTITESKFCIGWGSKLNLSQSSALNVEQNK